MQQHVNYVTIFNFENGQGHDINYLDFEDNFDIFYFRYFMFEHSRSLFRMNIKKVLRVTVIAY